MLFTIFPYFLYNWNYFSGLFHNISFHLIVASKLYGVDATIIIFVFVLYCIVLYCILLYCIVFYCIVLYCIVLYCIVSQLVVILRLIEWLSGWMIA